MSLILRILMIRSSIILIILLFLNLLSMRLFILAYIHSIRITHTSYTHLYRQLRIFPIRFFIISTIPRFSTYTVFKYIYVCILEIPFITYMMWFAIKMIYHGVKRFIWILSKVVLISHAYALREKMAHTHIHTHTHIKFWLNNNKLHWRQYMFFF